MRRQAQLFGNRPSPLAWARARLGFTSVALSLTLLHGAALMAPSSDKGTRPQIIFLFWNLPEAWKSFITVALNGAVLFAFVIYIYFMEDRVQSLKARGSVGRHLRRFWDDWASYWYSLLVLYVIRFVFVMPSISPNHQLSHKHHAAVTAITDLVPAVETYVGKWTFSVIGNLVSILMTYFLLKAYLVLLNAPKKEAVARESASTHDSPEPDATQLARVKKGSANKAVETLERKPPDLENFDHEDTYAKQKRLLKVWMLIASVLIVYLEVGAIRSAQPPEGASYLSPMLSVDKEMFILPELVTNVIAALGMLLLFSRFEGRYMKVPIAFIIFAYGYGLLQVPFVMADFLQSMQPVVTAMYAIAALMKLTVFWLVAWLLETGTIVFYLEHVSNGESGVAAEWAKFRARHPELKATMSKPLEDRALGKLCTNIVSLIHKTWHS